MTSIAVVSLSRHLTPSLGTRLRPLQLFNANMEMDGSDIMFADVMDLIEKYYESQLLEFKNGDIVNKQGENEGSAKIFSYAALSNLDKENTLKLFGEHYRSVKENPDGTDHQNIRNFMKYGWEGRFFGSKIRRRNHQSSHSLPSTPIFLFAYQVFLLKTALLLRARMLEKTNGICTRNLGSLNFYLGVFVVGCPSY